MPQPPRPPRKRAAAKPKSTPKAAPTSPPPADDPPPRPTDLSGDLEAKVGQFLTGTLGLGAAGVGDNYAAALVAQRVPLIAQSWADLAKQSPQVRATLDGLMQGGAWGGAIFSVVALLLPLAAHMGIPVMGRLKFDPFAPILNPTGDAAQQDGALILPVIIPRGRDAAGQQWGWSGQAVDRGPIVAPAAPVVPAPAPGTPPQPTGPETAWKTTWNPATEPTVPTAVPVYPPQTPVAPPGPMQVIMQPPPPPAHPSVVPPPAENGAPGPAAVSVLSPEGLGPVATPAPGPQLPGINSPAQEGGGGFSAPVGAGGVPGAVTVASVLAQRGQNGA